MTTFADGVRVGVAYWPTALSPSGAGEREDLGVQLPSLQRYQIGTASTTTGEVLEPTAAELAAADRGAL